MLQELRNKINVPTIEAERTATIVWRYLSETGKTPFFWNSFPFHPHKTDNPDTNRTPTKAEIGFGSQILADIVEIYKPELIAGIGHKGIQALKYTFPDQTFTYIRHPSNGGKTEFIRGMNSVI